MSPPLTKTRTVDVGSVCFGDCCVGAVKRAYREMMEQGQPEQFAREAAFRVFRWHHPEVPVPDVENIVALWVHEGAVH